MSYVSLTDAEAEDLYATLRALWPDWPPWQTVKSLHWIGTSSWHAAPFGGSAATALGYGPLMVTIFDQSGDRFHRASLPAQNRAWMIARFPVWGRWWDGTAGMMEGTWSR